MIINYQKHIKLGCIMVLLLALCCIPISCLNVGKEDSSLPSSADMQDFDYAADRVKLKVQIMGEGSLYSFDGLQPYFDEKGMTMLPMVHFDELFKGNVSYEIGEDSVTITKNVLDVITIVRVSADSHIMLKDGQEIKMNTMPVQKDGTIYIPLEHVGDALGYEVLWNTKFKEVRFDQYTSVYVYLWNEDDNSSSSGLRYSYIISGDYTLDMAMIKVNATSDFENVREVLNRLPSKAEVLTIKLYRLKRDDVPYNTYDAILREIFAMGLVTRSATHCLDEIPPIIKDLGEHTNNWYSLELHALDEEVLKPSQPAPQKPNLFFRQIPDILSVSQSVCHAV